MPSAKLRVCSTLPFDKPLVFSKPQDELQKIITSSPHLEPQLQTLKNSIKIVEDRQAEQLAEKENLMLGLHLRAMRAEQDLEEKRTELLEQRNQVENKMKSSVDALDKSRKLAIVLQQEVSRKEVRHFQSLRTIDSIEEKNCNLTLQVNKLEGELRKARETEALQDGKIEEYKAKARFYEDSFKPQMEVLEAEKKELHQRVEVLELDKRDTILKLRNVLCGLEPHKNETSTKEPNLKRGMMEDLEVKEGKRVCRSSHHDAVTERSSSVKEDAEVHLESSATDNMQSPIHQKPLSPAESETPNSWKILVFDEKIPVPSSEEIGEISQSGNGNVGAKDILSRRNSLTDMRSKPQPRRSMRLSRPRNCRHREPFGSLELSIISGDNCDG